MQLKTPFYARALTDYGQPPHSRVGHLTFYAGELIYVTKVDRDSPYWTGQVPKSQTSSSQNTSPGKFLATYVEIVPLEPGLQVISMWDHTTGVSFVPGGLDRLQFDAIQTIHVHRFGQETAGDQSLLENDNKCWEGQVVDAETGELVGKRGWFPIWIITIPFEAIARFDYDLSHPRYKPGDLILTEGNRVQVHRVHKGINGWWKGRVIDETTNRPTGPAAYFPSAHVKHVTLITKGTKYRWTNRTSTGKPAVPYRTFTSTDHGLRGRDEDEKEAGVHDDEGTGKKQKAEEVEGEGEEEEEEEEEEEDKKGMLIFRAGEPILVTNNDVLQRCRGILLHKETLESVGEEGWFSGYYLEGNPF